MKLKTGVIKIIMAEQGKDRKALAKALGCSYQNFCCILQKGRCREVTAVRLAGALGVPVAEIVEVE